ncbi:sensor histidine kinase [Microbacterium dextranolyticum]|uniref:histidine kinase n=2 Tax=Microbacterium dextranolyticum TaxID=36806 RepID=A0A9W6M6T2_9MICO|nr:two-component sensor histidine kinase [Microbacterium dextranolyticum]
MRMAIPPRATSGGGGDVRERIVASNQLFLCAVVGILFLVGVATGGLPDAATYGWGMLLIVAGGVAALSVPWSRVALGWSAVIPTIDVVAIALLRASDPSAGFPLLWAFPAIWLSSIGRIGLVVSCVGLPGLYWSMLAAGSTPRGTYSVLLLPLLLVAISAASYTVARRHESQRRLLDRQTERFAAAHREALRQEQLVTEVLDVVDFGVIRLSDSGEIILENDALTRFGDIPGFCGRTDDGELLDARLVPVPADRHPLARVRAGESFADVVAWFHRPDGRRTAMSFTGRQLSDHHGAPAGAVLIARDVTVEHDAQQARDDLVASISHELRTPLTSILGYLDLALEGGGLSDEARRQIDTSYRNSERLLGIVTDILAASSRSSASVDTRLRPRAVDVVEVARSAVSGLTPVAQERFVSIGVVRSGFAVAYADPARLRQVLDNLIANAIKFNRDGGTVTVRTSTDGVHTVVEVADTGVGMTPGAAARVFDRFFRAAPEIAGNGLGLSITRDLVNAHGGTIAVASVAGEGTTFTVTLPATEAVQRRELEERAQAELS